MDKIKTHWNKKGEMSISIVLLVFLTLVLIIASLFNFILEANTAKGFILSDTGINSAYLKEIELNSYMQNIVNSASFGEKNIDKAVFLENLKKEIENLKIKGQFPIKEMENIQQQFIGDNLVISANSIGIKLNIIISDQNVFYTYSKTFESKINLGGN